MVIKPISAGEKQTYSKDSHHYRWDDYPQYKELIDPGSYQQNIHIKNKQKLEHETNLIIFHTSKL